MDREYRIGKDYKNNTVINEIGTYSDLKEAKKACIKDYYVFDEKGNIVYSNNSKKYRILLLILLFVGMASVGATLGYFTLKDNGPENIIKLPTGMEIIYEGDKPIPDKCGIYVVPENGYKVILNDGSTKLLKEGTLIKSNGTIIEPGLYTKFIVDNFCNIIIKGDNGATVTLPNGKEVHLGDQSVVNPENVLVDPNGKDNLQIDDQGNIIVGDDGATITMPGGKEIDVPEGTIITPDGKVIIPDEDADININNDGKIVIDDGGTTIVTPNCGDVHYPKGTIIIPYGYIIKPNGNNNLTIDKNGYIIVGPGGATVIKKDCSELIVPPTTVINNDGVIVKPDDLESGIIVDEKGTIKVVDPDGGEILNPKCKDRKVPKGTVRVKGGTVVIPKSGELTFDKFGNVHVGEGGATVIMRNCTEKEVPAGTVITPGGEVIIKKEEEQEIKVDDGNNISVLDPGGTVITPECGEKALASGAIVVPGGTIVIPKDGVSSIDKFYYIHLPKGGTVILPNCTEEQVPPGTIITVPGTIIMPGDGTEPNIDNKGHIIVDDNGTKVIQPAGCKISVPKGSIIYKGLIIVGTTKESPEIKNGDIIIPKGGKIIYPDCREELYPNGGIVDEEGNTKHGIPTDPEPEPPVVEPPQPPVESLSIAYIAGQELNVTGVRPGEVAGSKTFYVKNTGTQTVSFNVLWTQVINDFARPQDLIVTIKKDGVILKNKIPVPIINGIMLGNISIGKGEQFAFELIFEYLETGLNQDEDQGKIFSTVIQIEAVQ